MDARIVERALQTNEIEIAPLAFMRGRTLSNAVVILDEAQNTTAMQMKMFLTRLGENSRMIVTGDPSQVDLPPGQVSGLAEATRLLDGVEGIGHRDVHRRGRGPPRARGADRRGLRQGRRGAKARDEGMSTLLRTSTRHARSRPRMHGGWGLLPRCGLSSAPPQPSPQAGREERVRTEVIVRSARWRKRPRRQNHRKTGRFGRGRSRLNARPPSLLSCSAMIRRSERSTATGAARTHRPTCCRSRLPPARPGKGAAGLPIYRRHRHRLSDHRARGGRRGQTVQPPSRPSRHSWIPASARL